MNAMMKRHERHDEEANHRPSSISSLASELLTIPLPQLRHYVVEQAKWSMAKVQCKPLP